MPFVKVFMLCAFGPLPANVFGWLAVLFLQALTPVPKAAFLSFDDVGQAILLQTDESVTLKIFA